MPATFKKYFLQTSSEKVRAIIITPNGGKRYDYIDNSPRGINTFLGFAKRTFRDASCINFYDPKKPIGQNFIEKIYLE